MDRNIGKILDYLDSTGLSKNTVVNYASDQGFYLGEHAGLTSAFMYDESFGRPFLIRYPGKNKTWNKNK
jgi:arylsulfatase A-like enzyme